MKEYPPLSKRARRLMNRRHRAYERKMEVLIHYSKDGVLGCCWPGCIIDDPQCLTIDHLNGTGSAHRRHLNSRSSSRLYCWLIAKGFPKGYQTLCGGHNQKVEIQRRIRERSK